MGAFTTGSLPALPSRHLGLVTADEVTLSDDAMESLADAAESCCDLSALLILAERARLSVEAPTRSTAVPQRVRIGIARDRAFHFYYPDNIDALEARGAEIVGFSPLDDDHLPRGIDLLYLGGGYPEAFASQLAANHAMRAAVRRHAAEGRPLYAECGGLLYLGESLELLDGSTHAMAGVLPCRGAMCRQRVALGYVEAELLEQSLLGPRGLVVRGHEFHYSKLRSTPEALTAPWSAAYRIKPQRGTPSQIEGFSCGDLLASYVHVHFASRPEVIDHLIERCLLRRVQTQVRST
jgi:cobyrinic acid a,c-diamide synthase